MSLSVKVHIHRKTGSEVRRFAAPQSFDELKSVVAHLFGSATSRLCVEYVDEEGDRIRMTTAVEWDECLRLHQAFGGPAALVLHVSRGKRSTPLAGGASATAAADSDDETGAFIATTSNMSAVTRISAAVPVVGSVVETPSAVDKVCDVPAPVAVEPVVPSSAAPAVPQLRILRARDEDEENCFFALLSYLFNCDAKGVLLADVALPGVMDRVVSRRRSAVGGVDDVLVEVHRENLLRVVIDESAKRIRACDHIRAEAVLRHGLSVFPQEAVLHYNLACALARQVRVDEALLALDGATAFGYNDYEHTQRDTDLLSVRSDPRFQQAVKRMMESKSDGAVLRLIELLPFLTIVQAKKYLADSKGDLERATHMALDACARW